MPTCIPAMAGQPYRPANGTEGEAFMAGPCAHCRIGAADCLIIGASMFFQVGDPEYPPELVRDDEGWPQCTSFQDKR